MEQQQMIAIPSPDLKRYVLPMVQEAYKISGLPAHDMESIQFTVEKFCDVLKYKYKNITLGMVSKFVNNGAWGEYGEFKNISVRTLAHWVASGSSRVNLNTKPAEDNLTMQRKSELLFVRMKEEVPELYEELMQSLDQMISRNAKVRKA